MKNISKANLNIKTNKRVIKHSLKPYWDELIYSLMATCILKSNYQIAILNLKVCQIMVKEATNINPKIYSLILEQLRFKISKT